MAVYSSKEMCNAAGVAIVAAFVLAYFSEYEKCLGDGLYLTAMNGLFRAT